MQGPIEGHGVERIICLDDVRHEVVMPRIVDLPDKIGLAKFHTPKTVTPDPKPAPTNTLGIRRIMFVVDDIDDVLALLRTHGAELEQYEQIFRLCYVCSPEDIIVGLAEEIA
ncbi:VOC family protein [Nocardia sp. NPDC004711]